MTACIPPLKQEAECRLHRQFSLVLSAWPGAALIVPGAPWLQDKLRCASLERALVQFQCSIFVASWTGVVRYHGPRPVNRPNHVWVCNHTSMIDYIILTAYSPFAGGA